MYLTRVPLVLFPLLFSLSLKSVASAPFPSNDFFRSLNLGLVGGGATDLLEGLKLDSFERIHHLFENLPSPSFNDEDKNKVRTIEKHYVDENGFDCHEKISTYFDSFSFPSRPTPHHYADSSFDNSDKKNNLEEKIEREGEKESLFRIQKKKRSLKEEEEASKAPDFVVEDGFYGEGPKEKEWFDL
ncbi:uncharacterized protein JCM6883_001058 [Sporobolomyces salmoneus]|uniref:uncharacterized protein n=1 Tax=Sporobolomyces salmoneus TaxID=183962 RepID=UPI0031730F09